MGRREKAKVVVLGAAEEHIVGGAAAELSRPLLPGIHGRGVAGGCAGPCSYLSPWPRFPIFFSLRL